MFRPKYSSGSLVVVFCLGGGGGGGDCAERSGSVGKLLTGIKGLLVQDSSLAESICCVPEQGTLSPAKY